MKISKETLQKKAKASGFKMEHLEKVLILMDLLSDFATFPQLKNKIVLKGGTALNLFFFNLPRLSIAKWGNNLIRQCQNDFNRLLPITIKEKEFLTNLFNKELIKPELISNDERLTANIKNHPAVKWSAQQVTQR